ncbi:hypothetical protein FRC09_006321 [Ceratobasidium sp. 395]|nr:hypothetical protein FRC09_006321 [Ceratobasidium sp. 395]
MASAIMNVIKEEAAVSATSITSITSAMTSAGRSTLSHTIATSAPSARVAVSHTGAESASLLASAGRREILQATRVKPVLGDLTTTAAESSPLSSILNSGTSSEAMALRNIIPELREQLSNAAQQGFEEAVVDQMPIFEPTWGVAETAKKLEEVVAAR